MSSRLQDLRDSPRIPPINPLPIPIHIPTQRNRVIRPLIHHHTPALPSPHTLHARHPRPSFSLIEKVCFGEHDRLELHAPGLRDGARERDGVGRVVDAREAGGREAGACEGEEEVAVACADFEDGGCWGVGGGRRVGEGPLDHFVSAAFAEPVKEGEVLS